MANGKGFMVGQKELRVLVFFCSLWMGCVLGFGYMLILGFGFCFLC